MMLELPAYAKINLGLEVTGKRPDGYHNIVSVMQLVDLHDTLTFSPADDIALFSDDPAMLAEGDNNLVLRAAHLLRQTSDTSDGAYITLDKGIPSAAGLGGGSSDAAATLLGLLRLWGLDVSLEELSRLGATLGSDVPFFFAGPTALVEGRGEQVIPLAPPPFWAVLVAQPYNIPGKTRQLYASLTPEDLGDGSRTREVLSVLQRRGDISSVPLFNSFERAAFQVFPGLDRVRGQMLQAGAPNVHLSGSGPTLYTLYPHSAADEAQRLYEALAGTGLRVYSVMSRT
ncbi:MAG: 4-(cytidine 5'-diphospho)-2-C-methyl-D-erythritol kinase [Chloroflexota bacterium]|nr:4-(cytidine 5'-diphospho)-2-C-methyl-D-erythritol kinase [Chloroflexota bacterium]MDQ5867912.1 4-(cytidine 5'-diphospho)-2-C-methyl-D-erythritol kinase [Chloroflexota bacterium]